MGSEAIQIRPRQPAQWAALARRNPSLLYRYGRSALHSRVLGPLASRRRLGAAAMFHVGRCGSAVLSDLLDQHPRIGWDGESYVRVLTEMNRDGVTPETSGFDPVAYIGGRLDRVGARWFLFNLKFDHVDRFGCEMARYVEGIERLGVSRLIVLRRRNLLRKLVSGKMAEARSTYQRRDSGPAEKLVVRIEVDEVEMDGRVDSLVGHLDRWERLYVDFERLVEGRPVLDLDYESDILDDPRVAYHKVIDHLGLAPRSVDVRLQRLNPFALGDVIENVEDVGKALRSTRHAWMLA